MAQQMTPWSAVVQIRPELKSGELTMSQFAADLYEVVLNRGAALYRDPEQFFTLTYPTYNLRELAKDVAHRLAGRNDKTVRQLELTYGGGKTHTLITLYHLANSPQSLPGVNAVQEFRNHIGLESLPRARVVVFPFDKLDVLQGLEVVAPDGSKKTLKQPWSLMAWQIAGQHGLDILGHDTGSDERESAPAESVLARLLAIPEQEGLATLILMDEVLMFAREKVGQDRNYIDRLENFFQYLSQATTKAKRCAMVISLLASDPNKSDTIGREVESRLSNILRREKDQSVQPVQKEDVAEVLRRRFFTAESIANRDNFKPHVTAALKGVKNLDENTKRDGQEAEKRFQASYPFHPELTEVFYVKWTQLEGFQRTRGILRTFALGLRDSAKWDTSPLVGANLFLQEPGKTGLVEAGKALAEVATREEYEGKRQEWMSILDSEIEKAREIQESFPALKSREIEQAVMATFLNSQPIGQKATLRDLVLMVSPTGPDKISLEKALKQWAETSWFLDDELFETDGQLPKNWRLGSRPNLKQMHDDAMTKVPGDVVESKLTEQIQSNTLLKVSSPYSACVSMHLLPNNPSFVPDDGQMRFVVLGPKGASSSGKPSAEAVKFLMETTSPDRPRTKKNCVVIAAPSPEGLDLVRRRIRESMAWDQVKSQLAGQELDPLRKAKLDTYITESKKAIAPAVRQAYQIVVTMGAEGQPIAFKLSHSEENVFTQILNDERTRIKTDQLNYEALMPDGPYGIWHADETAKRLSVLVESFATNPALPKMMETRPIRQTFATGCAEGHLMLRLQRPDRSVRTWWLEQPSEEELREAGLEVVLPEAAELAEIPEAALEPARLNQLWNSPEISVGDVARFFNGSGRLVFETGGYTEKVAVPKAAVGVVHRAIQNAVKSGRLWVTTQMAGFYKEELPESLFQDDLQLRKPPGEFHVSDILPEKLPEAWNGVMTTGEEILSRLSAKVGAPLPWSIVSRLIEDAHYGNSLELAPSSAQLPCKPTEAGRVIVQLRQKPETLPKPEGDTSVVTLPPVAPPVISPPIVPALPLDFRAELTQLELQDLVMKLGEIATAGVGLNLKYEVRVWSNSGNVPANKRTKVMEILKKVSENF